MCLITDAYFIWHQCPCNSFLLPEIDYIPGLFNIWISSCCNTFFFIKLMSDWGQGLIVNILLHSSLVHTEKKKGFRFLTFFLCRGEIEGEEKAAWTVLTITDIKGLNPSCLLCLVIPITRISSSFGNSTLFISLLGFQASSSQNSFPTGPAAYLLPFWLSPDELLSSSTAQLNHLHQRGSKVLPWSSISITESQNY